MESAYDKNTVPDLKVVSALNSMKAERANMSGCLFIGGLLICFLAYVLLSNPLQNSIWYWLTVLTTAVMVYFLFYTTKQAVADIRLRRKLDSQGIRVQATVVGHEVEEHDDKRDIHIVNYQFRPDFMAKYTDFSKDRRYFHTPLGGQLPALYLPENPEITGLVIE